MSENAQECRLTMDTSVENAIWLHRDDGQIRKFVECAGGLYTHDISNPSHKITTHIVHTQTVESRKSQYTQYKSARVDKAHNLIWCLPYPSQTEIEKIISNNFFHHNTIC